MTFPTIGEQMTIFALYGGLHVGTGSTHEAAKADALRNGAVDDAVAAHAHPDLIKAAIAGNDPGPMVTFGDWTITDPWIRLEPEQLRWLTEQICQYATEHRFDQAAFVAWLESIPGLGGYDYDAEGVELFIGDESPVWTPILHGGGSRWVVTHLGNT